MGAVASKRKKAKVWAWRLGVRFSGGARDFILLQINPDWLWGPTSLLFDR